MVVTPRLNAHVVIPLTRDACDTLSRGTILVLDHAVRAGSVDH